ncbi:hypothetical protein JTB14_028377 [Gonioctena quinquepunctata]|nr:hypothetical protein JTB14_028377 [Gonioctena quinquepunctata]
MNDIYGQTPVVEPVAIAASSKRDCNENDASGDGKSKKKKLTHSAKLHEWTREMLEESKKRGDGRERRHQENIENHVPIDQCTLDNRKFLCHNNSTCIDLLEACDGNHNCPDGSDEGALCKTPALSCIKHGCSHECFQLPNGPKCLCPPGYITEDDKHCKDINECEWFDICDQKCTNLPGSYECSCDHKYLLKEDKTTCKAVGGEALMVFSSKTEIRAYALDSGLYFPVATHLKQVVGVDYDGHHVYWTDIFAEHESIVRSIEDGSEQEVLITAGLGLPEDLAVDWLTGNIYFTDAEKKHIGVCNSQGSHCTVLVNEDVNKPRGLVLNVEEGDMYWTDWEKPAKIAYSMMDGTNDRPFVTSDIHWPNGLALDRPNQRLYWTDAKKMSLESIRLDGTDRRIVLEGIVKHPYAIAVFENKLYWSDWATHSIQSCDKFTGKNHSTIVKEDHDFIYGISIYHSALHKRLDNPCALSYCSDICLLNAKSYSCACPENKVLGSDKHICREIGPKQMLIAGTKNTLVHIEHQFLGKHDVTSLPTIAKNIGCLAFDSFNNSLLISDLDGKKIINLDMDNGISEVLEIDGLGTITAMDYDPRGNNLYVCDRDRGTVEVISLNTLARKILLHDTNGEIPEAVAVIPDEGVMFVSLRNADSRSSHLDRFNMDGTGRTHTMEDHLVGPVSLHYDPELHRVFFADAGTGAIESTSAEGDDRHEFRKLTTYPVSLTTLKDDLFWINANSKRLYWAEKKTATIYNKKITLDLSEEPKQLHLISVTPRSNLMGACRVNNNGCSHLCLLSQKTIVCACPSGFELTKDNRTCVKRAHCDDTEFLCPESNACVLKSLRCNGHKDCAFGEDEMDCEIDTNKCDKGYFQCNNGDCINNDYVCDHHYDCRDKSDEDKCEQRMRAECPPAHFGCGDGECISQSFKCDGYKDCLDSSDESNCESTFCADDQFRCDSGTCIPKSWECDHEYDCGDFSDEHALCSTSTCSPTMFTCGNGKCIERKLICDDIDDCGDHSDENACFAKSHPCALDHFACRSNTSICVPSTSKCNGTSECPRAEDEEGCGNCMVEEFSCENKKCIPVQWTCDGLDDCGDNSDEFAEECLRKNETLPELSVVHTSCEDGFRCKNGECLDLSLVCNSHHDCYDGSDEDGVCSTSCEGSRNRCTHICNKTPMGPSCACRPGFKLMGDGYSCMDLDECQNEPPDCSQICQNNDGGFSCDCYEGFMLKTDKKSCKAEGNPMTMIFTADGQIRQLSQKTNLLSIIFSSPTPRISSMDVLIDPKTIFFSIEETSTIHKIDLETQTRSFIRDLGQPQQIAVDWSTHNMYYYNSEANEKSIHVCNFEENCVKLIDIDPHRQVTALVVDSVNGFIFYASNSWYVFNSPTYIIYRSNLDGTELTNIVEITAGFVSDITFDHNKKQLFFTDQNSGKIISSTYEGSLITTLFSKVTRSFGLKFFQNNLYYSTPGGIVVVCRLYGFLKCDSFRLHSNTIDLFTISQQTLQPGVGNICRNHSCSNICVPVKFTPKCLETDHTPENVKKHKVHIVSAQTDTPDEESNSGSIAAGILIPILLIGIAALSIYLIKKRQPGGLSVRMRFYNPIYGKPVDDEKPILQPGQHEYANPVHFNKEDPDGTLEISPRKMPTVFEV